jgi:murein DD-endopeptidase MepM/ murein hydrolase activator NlpD
MPKRFYTFIIVPNASSRLHKLRVPAPAISLLAVIGFLSFLVAAGLGFSYAKMAFRVADYNQLQTENTELRVEKKNLEVSTKKLDTKIAQLENISQKITSLIESDSWNKRFSKLNLPAVGGSKIDYQTSEIIDGITSKANVETLKDRTSELENNLTLLQKVVEKRYEKLQFTPSIWPITGRIGSHYGRRLDPFTGEAEVHFGLDIAGLHGTAVRAPASGVVIYSSRKSDYGNLIMLDHGDGITTRYGHLSRYQVHTGQHVAKGEVIGYVGTTGRSTAPHLHYEVRLNDRPVNPRNYLPKS